MQDTQGWQEEMGEEGVYALGCVDGEGVEGVEDD